MMDDWPSISSEQCVIKCPYNLCHIVAFEQLQLHLAGCRKEYYKKRRFTTDLRKCKYNGSHYIPAPEIRFHEMICSGADLYNEIKEKMKLPPVPLQLDLETSDDKANSEENDVDDSVNLIEL